jgi:hypothetical protein
MKSIAVAFFIFIASFAYGEDSLVKGGKSPDGRFEVRIFQTDTQDPSDYYYAVVDAKSHKVIKKLSEGGGYALYKGVINTSEVLWHPSSHFFALTDHDGRHSIDMFIYEASSESITLIKQPEYYQNALGRIGATQGYLISVVKPISWDKDVLRCDLVFDATIPDFGRSPVYTAPFSLELRHGPNLTPFLLLDSMGKPTTTEQ